MSFSIAVIQFPGSNTERETFLACRRAGLRPVEFLWNNPAENLSTFDGYIIIGGFSYEDRSRAGIIAALDPIMDQVKIEAASNKPVLGICNGAQILVESGLVPGLEGYKTGIALTNNKRIKNGNVLGVGYYNAWTNLKMSVPPERCAFTRHLKNGDFIKTPLAHGEGRFVIPKQLLEKMISNNQVVYRYCNDSGHIVDGFPTNPNGSIYNVAAVCNASGNVMAIMPHPERTENGDALFTSMKEFIKMGYPIKKHKLSYNNTIYKYRCYSPEPISTEWAIDMIITDNEAVSVQNSLKKLGFDVSISKMTHWEILINNNIEKSLKKISETGELYNPNKEFIGNPQKNNNSTTFIIRPKEDIIGKSKFNVLFHQLNIKTLKKLKHGVLWNIIVNSGNFTV